MQGLQPLTASALSHLVVSACTPARDASLLTVVLNVDMTASHDSWDCMTLLSYESPEAWRSVVAVTLHVAMYARQSVSLCFTKGEECCQHRDLAERSRTTGTTQSCHQVFIQQRLYAQAFAKECYGNSNDTQRQQPFSRRQQ